MAVSEHDLELLECHLDGALDATEAEMLRDRLSVEPALVEELEQLQLLRTARRAVWETIQATDEQAEAMAARIRQAGQRRGVAGWIRPLRYVAAAAACVVIGFFVRTAIERGPGANPGAGDLNKPGVTVESRYEVTLRDEAGRVVAVQQFKTIEEAQEFAADLSQWQAQKAKLASGRFVISADRF